MKWSDQIRDICKISEVVSKYFRITRKSDDRYILKCPFHQEKTASFTLDDKRNLFYCFGCKAAGDSIRFVQMIEKVDFATACRKIADWYGLKLVRTEKDSDLQIADVIKKWCHESLKKNKPVLDYLYSRGLKDETIKKFWIGWLGSRGEFTKFCHTNNIKTDSLESIGLKENMLFLFENRIIFPIIMHDTVIGFGARKFFPNDDRCKYINTAESAYFNKKEVLYGLNEVKQSLSEELCLVEGYLDVCMCYQNGINAISSLGTAAGTKHLELAWTKSDEVAICFDGDLAGQKAVAKIAVEAFQVIEPGKILSFINMPAGQDPASFLQANGDFAELLANKEYLSDKIWKLVNPKKRTNPEVSVALYQKILKYTDMIKDPYLRKLYVDEFKNKWFTKQNQKTKSADATEKTKKNEVTLDPRKTYEQILLMTIVYYPNIWDQVCDYVLGMELEGDFYNLREIFLKNFPNNLDFEDDKMVKYCVGSCTLQKLNKIAPFTKATSTEEDVVSGWMEVFSFYQCCIGSRGLND